MEEYLFSGFRSSLHPEFQNTIMGLVTPRPMKPSKRLCLRQAMMWTATKLKLIRQWLQSSTAKHNEVPILESPRAWKPLGIQNPSRFDQERRSRCRLSTGDKGKILLLFFKKISFWFSECLSCWLWAAKQWLGHPMEMGGWFLSLANVGLPYTRWDFGCNRRGRESLQVAYN